MKQFFLPLQRYVVFSPAFCAAFLLSVANCGAAEPTLAPPPGPQVIERGPDGKVPIRGGSGVSAGRGEAVDGNLDLNLQYFGLNGLYESDTTVNATSPGVLLDPAQGNVCINNGVYYVELPARAGYGFISISLIGEIYCDKVASGSSTAGGSLSIPGFGWSAGAGTSHQNMIPINAPTDLYPILITLPNAGFKFPLVEVPLSAELPTKITLEDLLETPIANGPNKGRKPIALLHDNLTLYAQYVALLQEWMKGPKPSVDVARLHEAAYMQWLAKELVRELNRRKKQEVERAEMWNTIHLVR